MSSLDLEKLLLNLPKPALTRRADLRIRFLLYSAMAKARFSRLAAALSVRRFVPVGAFLLLVAIVFAIPGYAYASPEVTKGHILYPIKIGLEQAELSLAKDDSARAAVYGKFTSRRIDEAAVLAAAPGDSKPVLAETVRDVRVLAEKRDQAVVRAAIEPTSPRGTDITVERAANTEKLRVVARRIGVDAPKETIAAVALALEEESRPIKAIGRKGQRTERKDGERADEPAIPSVETMTGTAAESGETDEAEATNGARVAPTTESSAAADTATTGERDDVQSLAEKVRRQNAQTALEQVQVRVDRTKDRLKKRFQGERVDKLFQPVNETIDKAATTASGTAVTADEIKKKMETVEAVMKNAESFLELPPIETNTGRWPFGKKTDRGHRSDDGSDERTTNEDTPRKNGNDRTDPDTDNGRGGRDDD